MNTLNMATECELKQGLHAIIHTNIDLPKPHIERLLKLKFKTANPIVKHHCILAWIIAIDCVDKLSEKLKMFKCSSVLITEIDDRECVCVYECENDCKGEKIGELHTSKKPWGSFYRVVWSGELLRLTTRPDQIY